MRIAPRLFLSTFAATTLALPAAAQQQPLVEGPVPTTAVISVETKHDATFDPSTLVLKINGHDTPIAAIQKVGQVPAQVAILIDDGIRQSFALQLQDIEKSLFNWPPGTQLLIGYMMNGTVFTKGFTTSPQEAAKQLHITFSTPGSSASPYFCLQEFVKHWPSNTAGARVVLMITNGVDPYNGSTSILNQDSPYVQAAQEDAMRNGVSVYSIYFPDAGRFNRGGRASFSGLSYLNQVADATGGQVMSQITIAPPSIQPYLEQFQRDVTESYVVGFNVPAAQHRNDLDRLQIKTNQRDIKVHAPNSVQPGLATIPVARPTN